MADIQGVDISRYQGAEEMDGWGFVIVNVEDPGFDHKITRAKNLGIPWGPYTWIYPGNGRRDMERSVARTAPHGAPPMGHWLDYEQAGVSQGDIDAALQRAGELSVIERTGIYTYLYLIGGVNLRGRPLWLAYYPGSNDGTYLPGRGGDARSWQAKMWQYSSGGNLDRNVVIDEAWYHGGTGGAAVPAPTPDTPVDRRKNHMEMIVGPLAGQKGNVAVLCVLDKPKLYWSAESGHNEFGIPKGASDYMTTWSSGVQLTVLVNDGYKVNAGIMQGLKDAV
jgi:hypothetical protein